MLYLRLKCKKKLNKVILNILFNNEFIQTFIYFYFHIIFVIYSKTLLKYRISMMQRDNVFYILLFYNKASEKKSVYN